MTAVSDRPDQRPSGDKRGAGVSRSTHNSTRSSLENSKALTERIEALRHAVGASHVLLFNGTGHLLMQCGGSDFRDLGIVGVLLANITAAAQEMGRVLDEGGGFSLHFQEGKNIAVYSAAINEDVILCLILGRGRGSSRLGTVWFYMKQAIEDIRSYLRHREGQPMPPAGGNTEPRAAGTRRGQPAGPGEIASHPQPLMRVDHKPPDGWSGAEDTPLLTYEEAKKRGLVTLE